MTQRYAHLAPLLLRLALGAVFIAHGLPKLTAPGMTAGFFGKIGIPAPYVMVLVVGLIEAGGGLLLLLGVATRIVASLLALTMLTAILTAKRTVGFVGGWEFEMVLLAAALSLVLSGPVGERTNVSEP